MKSLRAPLVYAVAFAFGLGAASGCQTTGETPTTTSVCPGCAPRAGGETGDFGGASTACGYMFRSIEVDAAQAAALGFDVDEITRRLNREIDAPLVWQTYQEGAGHVEGVAPETETWVRATLSVSSYQHTRPDPEYCDGTLCRRGSVEVEQATCPHFLSMALTVDLETLDGVIHARARGDAVQWAKGFETEIGEDTADSVICHAYADLSEVTGTLRLTSEPEDRPHSGELTVVVELFADRSTGALWPALEYSEAPSPGVVESSDYAPIRGRWPAADALAEEPPAAGKDEP